MKNKTIRFLHDDGSTVIYNPQEKGGDTGVIIKDDMVTHCIVNTSKENPWASFQQAQRDAQQSEVPHSPEFNKNCFVLKTPDGVQLLAIPMNLECESVPLQDVLAAGEYKKTRHYKRLSQAERLIDAISSPSLYVNQHNFHPGVIREMKKYAKEHDIDLGGNASSRSR